jgi:hypothetical protein
MISQEILKQLASSGRYLNLRRFAGRLDNAKRRVHCVEGSVELYPPDITD